MADKGPDSSTVARLIESTEIKGISRLLPSVLLGIIGFLGLQVWGDIKAQREAFEDFKLELARDISNLTGRVNINEYRLNSNESRITALERNEGQNGKGR